MKKVKAKHTIVHDGQTLTPTTVFECPDKLYEDLKKADAIEDIKDESKVEAVKLKPVVSGPGAGLVPAPVTPPVFSSAPPPPPATVRAPFSPPAGDNDGLGK